VNTPIVDDAHFTKTETKLHGLSPQANYTDRLNDRRLSAKLVPTLADRGYRVVSATIPPQSFNLRFLDRSRYYREIAPQLSSRGWVDPVPDPLLLRKKSGSAGNRTQTSVSLTRNFDHISLKEEISGA
jgi:hypothetical protein